MKPQLLEDDAMRNAIARTIAARTSYPAETIVSILEETKSVDATLVAAEMALTKQSNIYDEARRLKEEYTDYLEKRLTHAECILGFLSSGYWHCILNDADDPIPTKIGDRILQYWEGNNIEKHTEIQAGQTVHLNSLILLQLVHDHFESEYTLPHVDGPGHAHRVKGRWDRDGAVCEWCKIWDQVKKCLNQNGKDETSDE